MFNDGAWLGWLVIVGSALASMLLFGFILPIRKRVKFSSPKSQDWGKVSGYFLNGKLVEVRSTSGYTWKNNTGGLFRIDCGINIPPGRTVGALYRTPVKPDRRASIYYYCVGNYLAQSRRDRAKRIARESVMETYHPPIIIDDPYQDLPSTPQSREKLMEWYTSTKICKPSSIEEGMEGTLPPTPGKQKGQGHALEGMGDQVKSDNQPLQNEARRDMQQRRRPRRVLMTREHPSDHLLGGQNGFSPSDVTISFNEPYTERQQQILQARGQIPTGFITPRGRMNRKMHEEIMRRKGEDDA